MSNVCVNLMPILLASKRAALSRQYSRGWIAAALSCAFGLQTAAWPSRCFVTQTCLMQQPQVLIANARW